VIELQVREHVYRIRVDRVVEMPDSRQRLAGIGHRASGIGHRASGIGHRDLAKMSSTIEPDDLSGDEMVAEQE